MAQNGGDGQPSSASSSAPPLVAVAPAPPQPVGKRDPHPQRDLIREKIDWYFSDENLRKGDLRFLTAINKDGENSAVNVYEPGARLRHICNPKPSAWQIIEACTESTVVDVVNKNHIRRKVPFVMPDDEDDDGVWGEGDKRPKLKPISVHPAIKSNKSKIKDATGFEPGFIDAPISPAVFEEERELYHPSTDFTNRISIAITRFVATRKWTSAHQKAFASFLRYGGIYPVNRIGQGETKKSIMEDEELSKEEKMELCAQYDVDEDDKMIDGRWGVDFEGVAKGFLSTEFAEDLDQDYDVTHLVDNQCDVLNKFYQYLLYHDVCPEYKADIIAAVKITATARDELKTIQQLVVQFPTPYSKACSVLFGGDWQQFYGYDMSWGDFKDEENPEMAEGDAAIVVGAALMALGSDAMYDAAFPQDKNKAEQNSFSNLSFTEERFATLEVVAIERATEDTIEIFKSSIEAKELKAGPVGKLVCKYWKMPTQDEWDIPKRLQPHVVHDQQYELWLEDDLLKDCFLGMKLAGTLRRLATVPSATAISDPANAHANEYIWVLDSISRIYCSFTTFLLNEMVTHKWKDPEFYSEDALKGCKHECADRGRDQLMRLKNDKLLKHEQGLDSEDESDGEDMLRSGGGEVKTNGVDKGKGKKVEMDMKSLLD